MPKLVDHEAYRLKLLGGCFILFAERGYAALTMRQIATGLGVSTGTLYHYFESKEVLFQKMLESLAERDVTDAVALLTENAPAADQLAQLLSFIESREAYFRSLLFIAMDYFRNRPEDGALPADSPVATIVQNYKRALASRTNLAAEPARAELLFTLLVGIIVNRLLDPESPSMEDQAEQLTALWAQAQILRG